MSDQLEMSVRKIREILCPECQRNFDTVLELWTGLGDERRKEADEYHQRLQERTEEERMRKDD